MGFAFALSAFPRVGLLWWLALLLQATALPGTLLPFLPGLVLLPLGALVWVLAVGWAAGWPPLLLSVAILGLGLAADALALVLGPARLKATRWAYLGAAAGLIVGMLGLLPALPFGGPLLGALVGPLLGASLGELITAPATLGPFGFGRLLRSVKVGLAVVAGLLVSRLSQFVLALIGVVGFVLLTRGSYG